jgi:hypothetical protein
MKAPDRGTERRLEEIRSEAARTGRVDAKGIRASGAPLPEASATNGYYGLPLLKQPVWTWEVPIYFVVGGAAGVAAMIGVAAQLSRADRGLVRDARWIAAIGANLSAPLLIADLGRPERFLNMLRVFKPQSPMSVGAWILSAFGAGAMGALILPGAFGDGAAVVSGLAGLGMATYTGVLLGATSIPVWSKHVAILPMHFGASSTGAAVSLLELRGHDNPALNTIGIAAASFETLTGARIELTRDVESEPLRRGRSGTMARIGGVLSGPVPLLLRVVGGRSKKIRRLAAVSTIAGSVITRLAWVAAGRASARDPRPALQLERSDAVRVRDAIGERATAGKNRDRESDPGGQQ